jgi:phosphate transport system ATP-binding protein
VNHPKIPIHPPSHLPFLEIERLTLYYQKRPAFADITMSIVAGKITTLVGPSGCGKTSFLNCLNRLVDEIPHTKITGSIRLDDREILLDRVAPIALRRRIGSIFQKPNPFPFSIWKNLALPLQERGIKDRDRLNCLIETTLQNVGLWHEVKDRLHGSALSLSGGQKQRLCIARALVLQPEVLLFDEPCSALDPISSGIVEDLISSLRDNYTVVIVTHNLAQAKRIGDYTALFWTKSDVGQLIEYDTTDRIFTSPQSNITAAYVNGMRG